MKSLRKILETKKMKLQQYNWQQLSKCSLAELKAILEKAREELYEIEKEKHALISAIMQTQAMARVEQRKDVVKIKKVRDAN